MNLLIPSNPSIQQKINFPVVAIATLAMCLHYFLICKVLQIFESKTIWQWKLDKLRPGEKTL